MQGGESGGCEGLEILMGNEIWINNRIESGFQKPEIVKRLVENNPQHIPRILVNI